MPKYINPTLTLTSNATSVSRNPGPLSIALALQVADSLSVDLVDHFTISAINNGTPTWGHPQEGSFNTLIDGSALAATAEATSSTHTGCWVVILNTTAVTSSELVYIGYTDDSDAISSGQTYTELSTSNENKRLFSLHAGEFAFFPFDYTGDLYCDASASSQSLEFWRFDRA